MTIVKASGHGDHALIRVETARTDEMPKGLPANAPTESPSDRGARGRFAAGNSLAETGGRAKRGKSRLTARLGLANLPEGNDFAQYRRAASTFRRVQCAELARCVGGGVCGPAPSSIVASAALALAWSRYFSDLAASTGDPELAVKAVRFGDSSRQALLTAHELCAREAQTRPRGSGQSPHERLAAALRADAAQREADLAAQKEKQ
jgi:hypothetical protein